MAITRYVKLNATSDAGDGTTVGGYLGGVDGFDRALDEVKGGDTIKLIGGTTYLTAPILINKGGNATDGVITIENYDTTEVILSGGLNNDWPPRDFAVYADGTVYYFPRNGGDSQLIRIEAGYITLSGITLQNSGAEGIRIHAPEGSANQISNVTINNVIIKDCYSAPLLVDDCSGLVVSNCKILDNLVSSQVYFAPGSSLAGYWGSGIAFNRCDSAKIYNNIVARNWGEGILVERNVFESSTSDSVEIYNNYIYDNHGPQIYLHGLNEGTNKIYNNVCYLKDTTPYSWNGIIINTTEADQNFYPTTIANLSIYNNLVYNCGVGLSLGNGNPSIIFTISNVKIQHNTLINNDIGFLDSGTGNNITWGSGNIFRNNLVYAFAGQRITAGSFGSTMFDTHDYNAWYIVSGSVSVPAGISGANDIEDTDPDLWNEMATVNSGTLDPANYIPNVTTSPLEDSGADSSITPDFYGVTRTAGNYDIGFAESDDNDTPTVDNLQPGFTTSPVAVGGIIELEVGDTIDFTDNTTATGSAAIDARLWEFGGGDPATSPAAGPTVTYSVPGRYGVKYTVYDATYPHLASGVTYEDTALVNVRSEAGGDELVFDVVQFNVGDTTINHSLGVVPAAALFVFGKGITADTAVDGISIGWSCTDVSPINSVATGTVMNDGTADGEGHRYTASDAVEIRSSTSTYSYTYATGTLTAASSTTLTMSWSGSDANELCYVILVGGTDIAAAESGTLTLTAVNDTATITGAYDVVIAMSTLSAASYNAGLNLGFAVRGGNQCCLSWHDARLSVGDPRAVIRNDSIAQSPLFLGRIEASFYSSYVQMTVKDYSIAAPTGGRMHYLALQLTSLSAACGVADSPSDTSATDYTLAFDPGLLICGLSNLTGANSVTLDDTAGYFGIFASDGTTAFSYGLTDEDASATINCATEASAGWRILNDDQTVEADGAIVLGTAKFTLTNSTAGGGKFIYLAFEDGGTGNDLTAAFSYTSPSMQSGESSPEAGETITFYNQSYGDGIYEIDTWTWVWNDGTANGTTEEPTHTYSRAGSYDIVLTVEDTNSATASVTVPIEIRPATSPVWSRTLSVTSGEAPLSVNVDFSASTVSGQTVDDDKGSAVFFRTERNFGSGILSYSGAGTSPTISVLTPGVYNLNLNLETTDGIYYSIGSPFDVVVDEYVGVLSVYDSVDIEIQTNPDYRQPIPSGTEINFTAVTSPDTAATSWVWSWGDGAPDGSGVEDSHTYGAVNTNTTYTVTLTGTFPSGLVDTATIYITVPASRTAPITEAQLRLLGPLVQQVSGCIDSTEWSATGGLTSTYEATLDRPWAAATAQVTEDGALLTKQTSTALVDANPGSYYVTFSDPDITIYVHASDSSDPGTNGSVYRFMRSDINRHRFEYLALGESVTIDGIPNPSVTDTATVGESVNVSIT